MNRFTLPLDKGTEKALSALRSGVARVGVTGRASSGELVFGCTIEAASGEAVCINATQQDLEHKFEVFPICAKINPTLEGAQELREHRMTEPVEVMFLQTQDWLDPGIPCEGAVGANPIAQCQGRPGEEPASAVATCCYFGGVRLRGANGVQLVVATLAFPYAIHVSAIPGTGSFDQDAYVDVAAGGA